MLGEASLEFWRYDLSSKIVSIYKASIDISERLHANSKYFSFVFFVVSTQ